MKRLHERVRRLLTVIPYLRNRQGITVEELAQYAGVSRRQVLKDLDCILMCGVPPYLPDDYVTCWIEDGRVYMQFADYFRRPTRLTLDEALALKIFLRELPPSLRAAHGPCLADIESKLLEATSAPVALSEVVEEQHPHTTDLSLLGSIDLAIAEHRRVRLCYFTYARGELSDRIVEPYRLAVHRGMIYVVGHCSLRNRVRSFRLDRVKSVELLDETFVPPEDADVSETMSLNIDDHEGERFTVRVRFSPVVARWIREEYAETVESVEVDGALIVTFDTDNPRWAALWLLRYGECAQILEPEAVRAEMRKLIEAMLSAAP